MNYTDTRTAEFISRPNRFVANVCLEGKLVVCHVKNTGRCKELLVPGAEVILEKSNNPKRKTEYDLIAVWKGDRLVNVDSQAPNKVFHEWVEAGEFLPGVTLIKPEYRFNGSRLDFYLEAEKRKVLVEVKGVTLEENGVVLFPDAPTERGVRHIFELVEAMESGYEAYIVFVIQMQDVLYFTPNNKTHPEFGQALVTAKEKGVEIVALDSNVAVDSIAPGNRVPVKLTEGSPAS